MTNPNRYGVSMNERMPSEVELHAIGFSFSLPAGKNLSRTWQRELRTQSESRFRASVSRERLEITFSPAILIDAQWPAMNMELGGATVDFATSRITTTLGSIRGIAEGLVDFSETAKKEVCALIAAGIAGTAMARPGYDALNDPHIVSTLEAIADNFRRQPTSGTSNVKTSDYGFPRMEVHVATSIEYRYVKDNAGLSMPKGTIIDIVIEGRGNLANMVASSGTAAQVRAANIQSVTIVSQGIAIIVHDKPIAYLDRMRIDRGGAVSLERMRLAGALDQAAGMESLFRVVASAMQMVSSGAHVDPALAASARSPVAVASVVPGLAKDEIESTLAEGVRELVHTYRWSIPEVDLEEIFGS